MTNPKTRIIASNSDTGLDIYLDISGNRHYLTSRRPSGLLYLWLKDGKTIGELSRTKPRYNRIAQKTYHYAQHLVQIAEEYISYELPTSA